MLRTINLNYMPIPEPQTEKVAVLGFIGRGLSKLAPASITKALNPLAQKAENALVGGATKYLNTDPNKTKRLLKGVPRRIIHESLTGGLFGGAIEGGLNALTAEPGERGSAFLRGAGSGALSGLGYGALTGAGTGLIRNSRRMQYGNLAAKHNLPAGQIRSRGNQMGVWEAMKRSVGKAAPGEELNQQIARTKLLGGLGIAGVELGVGPHGGGPSGAADAAPLAPPAQQPGLQPNNPAVYQQPQYYKQGSVITLKPIDFTNLPSYHR